jgi:hypothetical protein
MAKLTHKPKVRPGRVDDLAFAVAERVVQQKAPPLVQSIFEDAAPTLKALSRKYLKRFNVPVGVVVKAVRRQVEANGAR